MRVAMIVVSKPYGTTRSLRPFYVSERNAKLLERIKKARRLTPEEFAEYQASKTVASAPPIPQQLAVETRTVAPEMEEVTSFTTTEPGGEVTETETTPRRRGRPRKTTLTPIEPSE